jgi:hypothetical protein
MLAILNTAVIYYGVLALENVGTVNYHGIFIILALGLMLYTIKNVTYSNGLYLHVSMQETRFDVSYVSNHRKPCL